MHFYNHQSERNIRKTLKDSVSVNANVEYKGQWKVHKQHIRLF